MRLVWHGVEIPVNHADYPTSCLCVTLTLLGFDDRVENFVEGHRSVNVEQNLKHERLEAEMYDPCEVDTSTASSGGRGSSVCSNRR